MLENVFQVLRAARVAVFSDYLARRATRGTSLCWYVYLFKIQNCAVMFQRFSPRAVLNIGRKQARFAILYEIDYRPNRRSV